MAAASAQSVTTPAGRAQRGAGYVLRSLRDLRHDANLGLRELARASGVSQADLSKIERGKQLATAGEIAALSSALGLASGRLEVRTILAIEEHE